MEEMAEYRGYIIFWRRFSNDGRGWRTLQRRRQVYFRPRPRLRQPTSRAVIAMTC